MNNKVMSESSHVNFEQAKIYFLLGLEYFEKELYVDAELYFLKSLSLVPDRLSTLTNLFAIQIKLNKVESAYEVNTRAISLYPNDATLYLNQGHLHELQENWVNALASYDKAILLNPEFAEAHFNRGNALKHLEEFDNALFSYKKAISLRPDYVEAHSNMGFVLRTLKRLDEALICYENAIKFKPDDAEAHSNRGNVFRDLKLFEQALTSYDTSIYYKNDYAEAHFNRGITFQDLKQYDEAFASFDRAFALKPRIDYLPGYHLLTKFFLNDWNNLSNNLSYIQSRIYSEQNVVPPFALLAFLDDPELQSQTSINFVKHKWPVRKLTYDIEKPHFNVKLRIGYFSADLNYHPVCIWLTEQIENHDKSKFELFAFSLKSDIDDPMRARLKASFDSFIEVDGLSDYEVAKLSQDLKIDIALDLGGYTGDSRPGIFAYRAAPIQVNHLGFPGTMGSEYIDYFFSDINTVPEDSKRFFTEKIAYLPCGYTYDRKRTISNEPINREQFGLPENGFVFSCQNGNQKIHPEVFDIWMDILKSVPNSVLWLLKPNNTALNNLRKEAQNRGIDSDRLIFNERQTVSADREDSRISLYLASYSLADLFLDTWPYNAGTTAVDALWSGLPVLTKIGKSVVGRMAASALYAIEVPELITSTSIEYRDLAIDLATDSKKLSIIANKIKNNKTTTMLFNSSGNTKYYERAYIKMYERFCNNLPPDHIYI